MHKLVRTGPSGPSGPREITVRFSAFPFPSEEMAETLLRQTFIVISYIHTRGSKRGSGWVI